MQGTRSRRIRIDQKSRPPGFRVVLEQIDQADRGIHALQTDQALPRGLRSGGLSVGARLGKAPQFHRQKCPGGLLGLHAPLGKNRRPGGLTTPVPATDACPDNRRPNQGATDLTEGGVHPKKLSIKDERRGGGNGHSLSMIC